VKSCHALLPLFFAADPGWGEEEGSANPARRTMDGLAVAAGVLAGGGEPPRGGDFLFGGTTFCSD